jgi:hypothetical protein
MNKELRMYLKQTSTKIGILCLIIFGIISYNDDYMKEKIRRCIVLDKITQSGGYRSSGHFYLVLKEERGMVFDIIVSPSTFSQSNIGDTKYFELRQFDIRPTAVDNLTYFFMPFILFSVAIGFIVIGWVIMKDKQQDNENRN